MRTTWTVPATIVRVVDGDTLDAVLDLGWKITLRAKIRLAGINAPELSTEAGKAALAFARQAVEGNGSVATVISHQLDKYGRVLGTVQFANAATLNEMLVLAGHAVRSPS